MLTATAPLQPPHSAGLKRILHQRRNPKHPADPVCNREEVELRKSRKKLKKQKK